jgi:hypothetical protein
MTVEAAGAALSVVPKPTKTIFRFIQMLNKEAKTGCRDVFVLR